jgi:hypothetical protein
MRCPLRHAARAQKTFLHFGTLIKTWNAVDVFKIFFFYWIVLAFYLLFIFSMQLEIHFYWRIHWYICIYNSQSHLKGFDLTTSLYSSRDNTTRPRLQKSTYFIRFFNSTVRPQSKSCSMHLLHPSVFHGIIHTLTETLVALMKVVQKVDWVDICPNQQFVRIDILLESTFCSKRHVVRIDMLFESTSCLNRHLVRIDILFESTVCLNRHFVRYGNAFYLLMYLLL